MALEKVTNNNSFKKNEISTYEHGDIAILATAISVMTVSTTMNSKEMLTPAM
ncbi:40661_t:CDS:2 [Gigaspora margarita]|uniref:40661_t:CDS:1 n=1 Tax=Gigaspora margarita TaxID=4874 RepID=A0ABN7VAG3_GIGMA|nr:40661_t:CDS:2 [Gigaspora margarita]